MGPPAHRLQHAAHHSLDVAVAARLVLGADVAEPGIVLLD
jgi:hypothetical protein